MKVSSEWRVYLVGATLLVALTICSRNFGDRGGPYFMASLTVAGIVYLLAVCEFFRGGIRRRSIETLGTAELRSARTGEGARPHVDLAGGQSSISFGGPKAGGSLGEVRATSGSPRRVVIIGLLLAAVWHVQFLRLPAGADDDIHRYVWDGHLQRLGYNPYLVIPSDPAAERLHTPETGSLNNPGLSSPYPPGAQLFFRLVTGIHESTFALKVAFVVCELGIALILLDLLQTSGSGAHLVLAYAWNPLLAIEVAGSGHVDIVGALLLVISVAALARRWRAAAAVALGLAIAVKFLPMVLLPLYWKRVRLRDAALAAVVIVLLYVPFLDHGHIPIGSLGTYVQGFRFNGPVFAALDRVASPLLLACLAVLVGLATATWLRRATHEWSPDQFSWPMAASLLFAPVVFPWYLLWLLPFLTSASTLLIVVWTVSIFPIYVMWHLRTLGRPWGALPGWIMLLEYSCVTIAATIIVSRRRSQRPPWNT